jgi:glucose/arabinose dehydrogenase
MSRRTLLLTAGTGLAIGLAGCGGAGDGEPTTPPSETGTDTAEPTPGTGGSPASGDGGDGDGDGDGDSDGGELPDAVRLEPVATGFTSPIAVEATDDGQRRFVVDQAGRIWLHDTSGLRDRAYLDLRDRMIDVVGGYSERGLLGMALHPNFGENGRFFVRYSAPRRPDTPNDYSHTFVLSEFVADPGARRVDLDTERTILEIPQPQGNHNAGAIVFGPDGYLYVATGDGGGANDAGNGHVDDWYDEVTGGNGQDVANNLLGSILRIDVDDTQGDLAYAIPEDNPLVGKPGLDEHFAWGFRNPWRMSFTDGDLYAADVGQNQFEEVDLVRKGANYGWNVREGAHCFRADSCPDATPDGKRLRDPIVEYSHASGDGDPGGLAVIGGYLYRGDAVSGLQDRYVFADWRSNGRLYVATPRDEGLWPIETVSIANASDDAVGRYVLAFGRGPGDELFVATSDESGVVGTSGAIHRLRSTT